MKKERKCPCGSGVPFSLCCANIVDGETPKEIRRLIESIVIRAFERTGDTRGELCIYVAYLVKDLLDIHHIRSYIAAGSAKWEGYPHYFQWKPQALKPEFHCWVITQYGEIVDLSCDSFDTRHDAFRSVGPLLGIKSPSKCWGKTVPDRKYEVRDLGAKSLSIDRKGYEKIKAIALEIHERLVK